MIVNPDEAGVTERLEAAAELPAGPEILHRLRGGEEPFFVVTGGTGFEWGVANEIKGSPNRARLKLFVPEGVEDLVVVVGYKPSQIAWSRDRYAYGVWEIPVRAGEARIDPETLEAWLAFQVSGFHPEKRPANLLRHIGYDIPY